MLTTSDYYAATAATSKTNPAPPNKRHTDFDTVAQTLDMARRLANRVDEVTNRMIGPAPTTGACGAEAVDQSAVLPAMAQHALRTAASLNEALSSLDRLEQALP
ncbi:hypothetical protein [Bradyrhizobium sp. 33ap4]|uniref:hypothetical protein n=1 Tax=Bradyrhizobium sp. 33ap4 TaxID=3061630 RepID=UPI00292EF248|nr:hypothetical protein [Bradyrhizobium sp. 33ap4]